MKKIKWYSMIFMIAIMLLCSGCGNQNDLESNIDKKNDNENNMTVTANEVLPDIEVQVETTDTIQEMDWSDEFHGLNGSAVIYIPSRNQYMIYNQELSNVKRSPCSTFKIISSLIGLEKNVIQTDAVRKWSGENFWNEKWNRDINFKDAFQASCIWYFREVIDEIGKDTMQEQLEALQYGNCDISDWDGLLNNNNNIPALTGFWVESSLKISPKEQTEVMERIFGDNTIYGQQSLELLKDAMLITDTDIPNVEIYGKTGMGKSHGITVDAWYTGFARLQDEQVYFCIYLGENDKLDFGSTEAKEIAIQILSTLSE